MHSFLVAHPRLHPHTRLQWGESQLFLLQRPFTLEMTKLGFDISHTCETLWHQDHHFSKTRTCEHTCDITKGEQNMKILSATSHLYLSHTKPNSLVCCWFFVVFFCTLLLLFPLRLTGERCCMVWLSWSGFMQYIMSYVAPTDNSLPMWILFYVFIVAVFYACVFFLLWCYFLNQRKQGQPKRQWVLC